jgi:hypothetical protein
MKYINYFNNIKKFKYKKDIIKEINSIYNILLDDVQYKKIINNFLKENIIEKSSKKGKCAYISVCFLKEKNQPDAITFFNSLKNKKYTAHSDDKKNDIENVIPFNKEDCIIELNLTDIL